MKKDKENMTPKDMVESAPQEMPKQSFFSNKMNILAIIAIGLLLVSIAFNLILALGKKEPVEQTGNKEEITTEESTDDNLLFETHKIDKKVENGEITWIGIKTTPSEESISSNYELWRFEDNKKIIIDTFSLSACNSMVWNLNDTQGIDLKYSISPCVDTEIINNIIYNSKGEKQIRIGQDVSKSFYFTFQQKNRLEYEVSLTTDGVCGGLIKDQEKIPEVLLKGVKILGYNTEKEFNLDKPENVFCGIGYDEFFSNPIIKNIEFDQQKIEFTLPNKQRATISLDPANYANVTFE